MSALRCEVTGNLCGTDTWPEYYVCSCSPCMEWVESISPPRRVEVDEETFRKDMSAWFRKASSNAVVLVTRDGEVTQAIGGSMDPRTPQEKLFDNAREAWREMSADERSAVYGRLACSKQDCEACARNRVAVAVLKLSAKE